MNDDAYVIIVGCLNSLLYPLDELNTHAIRVYMTQGTFVKLLAEIWLICIQALPRLLVVETMILKLPLIKKKR